MESDPKKIILDGEAVLGIEFGSTRIKAVLIDKQFRPIAQGSHEWENRLCDGLWTYSVADIISGMQKCYESLAADVMQRYKVTIKSLASIGISAMMHGYLPFDAQGNLLTPFRTWRNTNTAKASAALSALFNFNIPLRWSISHIYQAILDDEPHVAQIASVNTLAGYIHTLLTGYRVLGVGDASGMLPVDPVTKKFDAGMIAKFDALIAERNYPWTLESILPEILQAGQNAGHLTQSGALLLDPSGNLMPGIPFCPPEGDAGTGMVATNAVKVRTGNVSAGTSSFSMIVLEKELSKPYEMIDIVTTPDGNPVAMVHCNNCTSDLNAWVGLFREFAALTGGDTNPDNIYSRLYHHAMTGDPDCGGLVAYNYFSGEPVMGFVEGRPIFLRSVTDHFNLANFIRAHLHASVAVLKVGNDILFNQEHITVDRITGHGGLFRTQGPGQHVLAAALATPISVMSTAGEGGAWGMAILAAYLTDNPDGLSLPDYLDTEVFAGNKASEIKPTPEEIEGFNRYMKVYIDNLPVEAAAVEFK